MVKNYDYIIIGAGHNGLIAACYLARAGKSVLVLEKRDAIGGMSISAPLVADAPHHHLSPGAIDCVFIRGTPIFEELALFDHGLNLIDVDPGYGWINEDGETLMLFTDPMATARDIRRFSDRDGRRYLALAEAFQRMATIHGQLLFRPLDEIGWRHFLKAAIQGCADRGVRRLLASLVSMSAFEAIAEHFESEALRGLYAYWCSIACPLDAANSGVFLASFSQVHQHGCSRPAGGMSALMRALDGCLRKYGGEIRTATEVSEVNILGGRATGVTLTSGEIIAATAGVVGACAPQLLYQRLLGDHCPDNISAKVAGMPANSNNLGPLKVDMAMSSITGFERAMQVRKKWDNVDIGGASMMAGTLNDHLEHSVQVRRGELGASPPIWMTALSYADPGLCPPDQTVLYLYTGVPVNSHIPAEGLRRQAADRLVSTASRYLEGMQSEIGRSVLMPSDFERDYAAPNGCIYHVDMLPSRIGPMRPSSGLAGAVTPIKGLYLGGAGQHPGGGVFGLPGKFAAMSALKGE